MDRGEKGQVWVCFVFLICNLGRSGRTHYMCTGKYGRMGLDGSDSPVSWARVGKPLDGLVVWLRLHLRCSLLADT